MPMPVDEYMEKNGTCFTVKENVFDHDNCISEIEDRYVYGIKPTNDLDRHIEELKEKLK